MNDLRNLPGVDALIQDESLQATLAEFGISSVKQAIRDIQAEIRKSKIVPDWSVRPEGYLEPIKSILYSDTYRSLFNLT